MNVCVYGVCVWGWGGDIYVMCACLCVHELQVCVASVCELHVRACVHVNNMTFDVVRLDWSTCGTTSRSRKMTS